MSSRQIAVGDVDPQSTKSVAKSGTQTPAQMLVRTSGSLSGTPTEIQNAYQNSLTVTADTMDTTGSTDRGQAGALYINHLVGGAAEKAGRVTLNSNITVTGGTGNVAAGINPFYVSGGFYATATGNDGGLSGAHSGQLFGLNANVTLGVSASFWSTLCGGEIDVAAKTGSNVHHKIGLQIVQTTSDAVAGDFSDSAFSISNQAAAGSGTPGWSIGIQFGNYNGFNPIAAGGTLIGTGVHAGGAGQVGTVTNGIDFTKYNFTGNAFQSNGFAVDGSGNITAANLGAAVSVSPVYVANNWYIPPGVLVNGAAGNPGSTAIKLFPFIARATVTISALGLRLGGTAFSGGSIAAAIYASNPTTGKPTGAALATTATNMSTTTATTNVNSALAANYQLQAGKLYYMASQMDNTTAIVIPVSPNGFEGSWLIGSPSQAGNLAGVSASWQGYQVTNTFSGTPMTWPDLTSATITDNVTVNSCPVVQMKVASVP